MDVKNIAADRLPWPCYKEKTDKNKGIFENTER